MKSFEETKSLWQETKHQEIKLNSLNKTSMEKVIKSRVNKEKKS